MTFIIDQTARDELLPLLKECIPSYVSEATASSDMGDPWWDKYPELEASPELKGVGIPSWWKGPPEGVVCSSNKYFDRPKN